MQAHTHSILIGYIDLLFLFAIPVVLGIFHQVHCLAIHSEIAVAFSLVQTAAPSTTKQSPHDSQMHTNTHGDYTQVNIPVV